MKRVQQQEEHFRRVKVKIPWCSFKETKVLGARVVFLAVHLACILGVLELPWSNTNLNAFVFCFFNFSSSLNTLLFIYLLLIKFSLP